MGRFFQTLAGSATPTSGSTQNGAGDAAHRDGCPPCRRRYRTLPLISTPTITSQLRSSSGWTESSNSSSSWRYHQQSKTYISRPQPARRSIEKSRRASLPAETGGRTIIRGFTRPRHGNPKRVRRKHSLGQAAVVHRRWLQLFAVILSFRYDRAVFAVETATRNEESSVRARLEESGEEDSSGVSFPRQTEGLAALRGDNGARVRTQQDEIAAVARQLTGEMGTEDGKGGADEQTTGDEEEAERSTAAKRAVDAVPAAEWLAVLSKADTTSASSAGAGNGKNNNSRGKGATTPDSTFKAKERRANVDGGHIGSSDGIRSVVGGKLEPLNADWSRQEAEQGLELEKTDAIVDLAVVDAHGLTRASVSGGVANEQAGGISKHAAKSAKEEKSKGKRGKEGAGARHGLVGARSKDRQDDSTAASREKGSRSSAGANKAAATATQRDGAGEASPVHEEAERRRRGTVYGEGVQADGGDGQQQQHQQQKQSDRLSEIVAVANAARGRPRNGNKRAEEKGRETEGEEVVKGVTETLPKPSEGESSDAVVNKRLVAPEDILQQWRNVEDASDSVKDASGGAWLGSKEHHEDAGQTSRESINRKSRESKESPRQLDNGSLFPLEQLDLRDQQQQVLQFQEEGVGDRGAAQWLGQASAGIVGDGGMLVDVEEIDGTAVPAAGIVGDGGMLVDVEEIDGTAVPTAGNETNGLQNVQSGLDNIRTIETEVEKHVDELLDLFANDHGGGRYQTAAKGVRQEVDDIRAELIKLLKLINTTTDGVKGAETELLRKDAELVELHAIGEEQGARYMLEEHRVKVDYTTGKIQWENGESIKDPAKAKHGHSAGGSGIGTGDSETPQVEKQRREGSKKQDWRKDIERIKEEWDPAVLHLDPRLLRDFVILCMSAALGGVCAAGFGLPDTLGYIMGGMIVGPTGLDVIRMVKQVETFAQFGSIFLLFGHGLLYSTFMHAGAAQSTAYAPQGRIGAFTVLFVVFSALLVCAALIGIDGFVESVFLSAAATLSSTAMVTEFVAHSRLGDTVFARMVVDLVTVQDLVMCPLLAIPTAIMYALEEPQGVEVILRRVLVCTAILVAFVVASRRLLPALMHLLVLKDKEKEQSSSGLFTLGVVSYCLGVALVCERLNLSHEAGALFAGLLMVDSPYAKKAHACMKPLTSLFGGMYLGSLGMIVDPAFIIWNFGEVFGCVLLLVVIKTVIVAMVMKSFGFTWEASTLAGACMAQVSEISLFFIARAQNLKLVTRYHYLLAVATTIILMVASPVVINGLQRLSRRNFGQSGGDSATATDTPMLGTAGGRGWLSPVRLADRSDRKKREGGLVSVLGSTKGFNRGDVGGSNGNGSIIEGNGTSSGVATGGGGGELGGGTRRRLMLV